MTMLIKNQKVNESIVVSKESASSFSTPQHKAIGLGFNVQSNRITNRNETYLKIAGAFKCEVENNGNVDIIIFGGYKLPSYSKKTFETGDSNLVFKSDTPIQYAALSSVENIDILLTTYTK